MKENSVIALYVAVNTLGLESRGVCENTQTNGNNRRHIQGFTIPKEPTRFRSISRRYASTIELIKINNYEQNRIIQSISID